MARLRLINRSGYDTEDLKRFFAIALPRFGVRDDVTVIVKSSPIRTRGCSWVGESKGPHGHARRGEIVIAIAPPAYNANHEATIRKLVLITRHEAKHHLGLEHSDMPDPVLYSEGPAPAWTRGMRIRYRGRAPNQFETVRIRKKTRR